ncbi:MAG: hypothetical protein H6620_10985 [Halobacteriovoraceae bacterium]|nr:hypothetical protein [Halobacteriovoraceae bacterium]
MSLHKTSIFISYLFVILGFLYTDDLYQNNNENLLVAKEKVMEESEDILLLHFSDGLDHRTELNSLPQVKDLEVEIIGPRELSKKNNFDEIKDFFRTKPELDLKLINPWGTTYLLKLKREHRREHPLLIQEILKHFRSVKIAGAPYLNYEIGKTTLDIKTKILPTLLIVSFLILLFISRNFWLSITLFLFPLSSISISLVLLKVIFGESNLLSNLAPLVSFVVMMGVGLHFFYSLLTFSDFKELKKYKLKPILFMLLTTIMGVFSLYISPVPAIQSFSLVTTLALVISSVFTLSMFRFLYPFIKNKARKGLFFQPRTPKVGKTVIIFSLTLPFIFFFIFKNKMNIQTEALFFFPQSHSLIQDTQFIENNIIGAPILRIKIKGFELKENDKEIPILQKVESEIKAIFGANDTTIVSPLQSIKNANYIYTGKKEIPQFKISTLTLMAQLPEFLKPKEEEDYTIQVLSKTTDTPLYFSNLKKTKDLLVKAHLPYEFYGNYYALMSSQSDIISTLMKSFLLSLAFISLFIGFYFKKIKEFLIFLMINILPPIATLVILAVFDIPLNLATIMTFSVSFGLIVDSTIHILHAQKTDLNEEEKSQSVYMPILISTLVLVVGFSTFILHPFVPIWQFGLCLLLTTLFGFFYDFFILPNLSSKPTLNQ